MRGQEVVLEVDVTPVLHAIDRASLRMQGLTGVAVHEYAKAAMQELGKIALAKQAYDELVERETARVLRERSAQQQFVTVRPVELRQ